jgi:hypothetical protein
MKGKQSDREVGRRKRNMKIKIQIERRKMFERNTSLKRD